MRVALIIGAFGGSRGGAERVSECLARGLAARRHDVDVYASRFDSDAPVRRVGVERPGHREFAENVARALHGERYDVVHSFARTYSQDIYRLGGGCHVEYLRRTDPGGLRGWFRRVNPKERAILELERRAMESRIVAAVSDRTAREARDHYGVPDDRLVVIRNGVDTERFHPRNVGLWRDRIRAEFGLSGYVVLFAGSGARRKGLRAAVEAVRGVGTLLVLGESGVEGAVCAGRRADAEAFYAAADALILPSLYDPSPNVVFEAMATGIPAIVTPVTGTAEIITSGVDGIVAESPAKPVRELADPRRRREMGAAARATAEQFGADRFVEENLKLYSRLS